MSLSLVRLYCYDLSGGVAQNMSMMLLGQHLEGIWHTAIVVFGKEYYFDGGTGIVYETPGNTRFGAPRRVEQLGTTTKTDAEFVLWTLQQRRSGFGPNDYSLLGRNCNHFTQEASRFLVGRDIPEDIRNMIPMVLNTPLGRMLRPMLEQVTSAPPGQTSSIPGGNVSAPMAPSTSATLTGASTSGATCVTLLSTKECFTEEEEADLMIAQAMLQSNEYTSSTAGGIASTIAALELLRSVFSNIVEHPENAAYRGISASSQSYKSKLLPLEKFGLTEMLRLGGFHLRQHPSSPGQQWFLSDADGSADILSILIGHLSDVIEILESETVVKTSTPPTQARSPESNEILWFFTLPAPAGFHPFTIGEEHGNKIFSCSTIFKGELRLGKCELGVDHDHIAAYICDGEYREACVARYEVLCVRDGCEEELIWLPAAEILDKRKMPPEVAKMAVFRVDERYGIIRASCGGGVHAGILETSGRCIIPYDGVAKRCNGIAQVLCFKTHVPTLLISEILKTEEAESIARSIECNHGKPILSLKDLLNWSPGKKGSIIPAVACRRPHHRVGGLIAERSRLLVCHDMRGGYLPGDYPHFALCQGTTSTQGSDEEGVEKVVDSSYTVSYWHLVDLFVYFSHNRISVPPKEWINAAHQHGVPVLGTFITEKDASDLYKLVHSPKDMSAVIQKLVLLCDTYNFDGYLINIESHLDENLAKRLPMFVDMLRQKLNKNLDPGSLQRIVIWYDAITIEGKNYSQRSLTAKNKPFFDVSSGIFTDYFWNPMNVQLAKTMASNRASDVYIGVDVFGRNMYGGGGYNTKIAAQVATKAGLSVALFATGWTCEIEGKNKRENFLRADSVLWSTLQNLFDRHALEIETLPVWTCFRSGVGKHFYVNGESVVNQKSGTEWCQLSQAHLEPCFSYAERTENNDGPLILLPLERECKNTNETVPATWNTNTAWMGDRSLAFDVPTRAAVTLINWRVGLGTSSFGSDILAAIDIAWMCSNPDGKDEGISSRCVRVRGLSATSSGSQENSMEFTFKGESTLDASIRVVARIGQWVIVRYTIPARVELSCLTSVAILNESAVKTLRCTIGGIGILPPDVANNPTHSVLMAEPRFHLPNEMFSVTQTARSIVRLVQINIPEKNEENPLPNEALVFAKVNTGSAVTLMYTGQHTIRKSTAFLLHLPNSAFVEELYMHHISPGVKQKRRCKLGNN